MTSMTSLTAGGDVKAGKAQGHVNEQVHGPLPDRGHPGHAGKGLAGDIRERSEALLERAGRYLAKMRASHARGEDFEAVLLAGALACEFIGSSPSVLQVIRANAKDIESVFFGFLGPTGTIFDILDVPKVLSLVPTLEPEVAELLEQVDGIRPVEALLGKDPMVRLQNLWRLACLVRDGVIGAP